MKINFFTMLLPIASFLILTALFASSVEARVTPEDIINSKKQAYVEKVKNYSIENRKNLEELSVKIASVNKKRTDELDKIMQVQGALLDEYERREGEGKKEVIEKARYWVTYAHEAVAYQAAKVYVFNLSSEANIKNDTLATVSILQSELNSTRSKVINSQEFLKEAIR